MFITKKQFCKNNLGEHKRPEAFIELAKNKNSTYKFVMIGEDANQNYKRFA